MILRRKPVSQWEQRRRQVAEGALGILPGRTKQNSSKLSRLGTLGLAAVAGYGLYRLFRDPRAQAAGQRALRAAPEPVRQRIGSLGTRAARTKTWLSERGRSGSGNSELTDGSGIGGRSTARATIVA